MLFKHFEVKGGADRVLIYLTLYVTQCLKKLEGCATQVEALKALTAMAHEMFKLPGEPGFPLGSFFPSAERVCAAFGVRRTQTAHSSQSVNTGPAGASFDWSIGGIF